MNYKLAFIGFGNVGRALIRLLERKRATLKNQYDITFSMTGVATGKHGFAVDPNGLDIEKALALAGSDRSLSGLSAWAVNDAPSVIKFSEADVMFENSPLNHENGQPAIAHVQAALEAGMHAITANKGTVVFGYRALSALAKSKNRKFYFESTVLGGTPVFSVFRTAMPGAELASFQGIINSTTNIILTRMEHGETFDEAVRYCQDIGVAEADPANDVDGWDAAIKVAALITVLMDTPFTPQQVNRTGIRGITPETIRSAKERGQRWKLVASAGRSGGQIQARVAPELVDASSRLYGMESASAGLEFRTDVLGDLAIIQTERPGLGAGPEETAYGLFADFINAVK
ncbi:MAG TPA: homoserine dehydrogenase [Anaerolineales bacterium]|nr:homoserine dehydrogenase [Anaerolineales bacterium]